MPWEVLHHLLPGGCVSGAAISAALGISRAAVWKRVSLLRERGFKIRAIPSQGYLLDDVPDLSAEHVKAGILGGLWKDVLLFDTVGSTNEAAVAGEALQAGTVIIADSQSRGRGRLGRNWISPPRANIYMSLVLRPELMLRDAALLTLLAAVSCAAGIAATTGLKVLIKWPNDLMVGGKKLGGILTEIRSDPDRILQAVIGIGINVNMPGDSLPEQIRTLATSVSDESGRQWRRGALVIAILREFEQGWHNLRESGRGALIERLRDISSTIGREVSVTVGDERISGFAEGIDDGGLLLLRLASGELRRISSGDIQHLR